jgi:hypothetical protein
LNDEFMGGIWWVPADNTASCSGIVRNASPKECADEIMRLRRLLAAIIETDERGQGYAEAMDAAKAIGDQSLK